MAPLLRAAVCALLLCITSTGVAALPRITRTGRYLYSQDGTRFIIKGVAYQAPGAHRTTYHSRVLVVTDILADPTACTRDLPMLRALGVNTIRTYQVDSNANHDGCMQMLEDAGIYVILDLALPLTGSIDSNQPTWTTDLLDQYIRTINTFSKYNNILAFEARGTRLSNRTQLHLLHSSKPPRGINSISSSALVSYAAVDQSSPALLAQYLSCDPSGTGSGSASIDLFGLNNYEWCNDAPASTYDGTNAAMKDYNVAAYFSEYGSEECKPSARIWTEVPTLFSPSMTEIWSGGVAYSYLPAADQGLQYGMIVLSSDNKTVSRTPDFDNLVAQYAKVDLGSLNSPAQSSVKPTAFGTCPGPSANLTASTKLPPTPDDAVCGCVPAKLSCVYNVGDVGELFKTVCDPEHLDCKDINGDGAKGTYGPMSMCDPKTRLSYVLSEYYDANRATQPQAACDWSGGAKLNVQLGSAGLPAAAALAACPNKAHALGAAFTPTAPAGAATAVKNSPTDTSVPSGASHAPAASSSSSTSAGGSTSTGRATGLGPRPDDLLLIGVLLASGILR
ncbi:1,3-beta-glucanosyltransferase [Mycena kentingensis (nom. inval.)]|nr:1,3-beta-glucanosyltransferase [Mycena kentingensis (nom. inval.)]